MLVSRLQKQHLNTVHLVRDKLGLLYGQWPKQQSYKCIALKARAFELMRTNKFMLEGKLKLKTFRHGGSIKKLRSDPPLGCFSTAMNILSHLVEHAPLVTLTT